MNEFAATVLTEESPRYRTPFTKETAKEYGRKGGLKRGQQIAEVAQAARKAKHQEIIQLSASLPEIKPKLDTLRRMQRRALMQAMAENDSVKQLNFMKSAQMAFDMEQTLLGNGSHRPKSRKSSSLSPHDLPMPDPSSCGIVPALPQDASESGTPRVLQPDAQSASGQATEAQSDLIEDDTPF